MSFSELSHHVIGCAIEAHRALGPGLLESTYEQCLAHELKLQDIAFTRQHPLPVEYKGLRLDCGYRVDILVEKQMILELKSVEHLLGIHEAQLLTYMKLASVRHGFLINFNVKHLKDGLKSFVLECQRKKVFSTHLLGVPDSTEPLFVIHLSSCSSWPSWPSW